MLSRLFPPAVESRHKTSLPAIALLSLLVLVKMAQGISVAGLNPWKSGRSILETVDGVPLSTFPAEASDHLIFLFAVWGLCVFIICLFGLIALLRYRALVPLAFLLLLFEQLGRKLLAGAYLHRPFLSAQLTPAALINWGFLAAIAIGLILSVSTRKKVPESPLG